MPILSYDTPRTIGAASRWQKPPVAVRDVCPINLLVPGLDELGGRSRPGPAPPVAR